MPFFLHAFSVSGERIEEVIKPCFPHNLPGALPYRQPEVRAFGNAKDLAQVYGERRVTAALDQAMPCAGSQRRE